jgi:hypothetical protein
MQRKTKRIVAAVAVIALLAAGGAAFTNSIGGVPSSTIAGFSKSTITGATATNLHYVLSTDGQYVDSVTVTLDGDRRTGNNINAGFNNTLVACTPNATLNGSDTDVTCDFESSPGDATSGVPVHTATEFDMSVTDSTSGLGS